MRYTWNSDKNETNLKRHGLLLSDSARIFDGPTLERLDDRFNYGEERWYAIGLMNGLEITVIYTDIAPDTRRLISAWRSAKHEREAFWKMVDHDLN